MPSNDKIQWSQLVELFSDRFHRDVTDRITVGPLSIEDKRIAGVMVHCHSDGLFVSRRPFPWFRGRLWIPWSLVNSVHILPSPLRGKLSVHTDANLELGENAEMRMRLPWYTRFSEVLPPEIRVTGSTN